MHSATVKFDVWEERVRIKMRYRIGSISVPGAILNIEGKKYKLPVLLSVNGFMKKVRM